MTEDDTARVWNVGLLPDDLERAGTWVETLTGMTLDAQGSIQALDNAAWQQRRERLAHEGGAR